MSNSAAIDCVVEAVRSGGPINTAEVAVRSGMSRRWVQEKLKTLRETSLHNTAPDPPAPARPAPKFVRFRNGRGSPGAVTHYVSAGVAGTSQPNHTGLALCDEGDHHDA